MASSQEVISEQYLRPSQVKSDEVSGSSSSLASTESERYSGSEVGSSSAVGDEYCEYACQPKAPSTTPTSTFFKRCRYSFKGNLTPKLSDGRTL